MVSINLYSETIELAKITNDINEEISILGINDNGDEIDSFFMTTYLNGEETDYSEYPAEEIYKGVVIMSMKGMDVVTLKSDDFDLANGGTIEIKYIYSAITKKYKHVTISLSYNGNEWELFTEENDYFNKIFCKATRVLGKPVGIKKIYFKTN
jgi:hypothetical protein